MTATLFHPGDPGYERVAAFGPCPNPHATTWRYDRGTAGKLAELCGVQVPFWNLFGKEPETWQRLESQRVAQEWLSAHSQERLILMMGARVCYAFGIANPTWLEIYERDEKSALAVPHPSGLNRWWNKKGNTELARETLQAAIRL